MSSVSFLCLAHFTSIVPLGLTRLTLDDCLVVLVTDGLMPQGARVTKKEGAYTGSRLAGGTRLVPEGFAGRNAGPGRLPLGPHRVGHLRAEPRGRGDAAARAGAHGHRLAQERGARGQAQRERDDSLWARSTEVVYSVRSSSSELDGAGADFSQAFAYEGGMVWDFVYARRLLSNGTYRPHDAALGFEHCVVAKADR